MKNKIKKLINDYTINFNVMKLDGTDNELLRLVDNIIDIVHDEDKNPNVYVPINKLEEEYIRQLRQQFIFDNYKDKNRELLVKQADYFINYIMTGKS